MNTSTILGRLNAIAAAIGEARATVDGGGGVDLAEMEGAVAEVCDDITRAVEPAERAEIATHLQAIVTDLDELAASLARQQQRLGESEGLNAAARRAYGDGDDPGNGSGD